MALHRDLMRNTGHYTTLSNQAARFENMMADGSPEDGRRPLPPLPRFNFLGIQDPVLRKSISDIALPVDRERMEAYATNRDLGVAMVAAPGGTGKTTAIVQLALGGLYSSGGKVYGSGPTNTAVTNFAQRAYAVGSQVAHRCNAAADMELDSPTYRRPLVVRGYQGKVEVAAFLSMLQTGVADNDAYRKRSPSDTPRWQLALSASNWFLAVLRSEPLSKSQIDVAVKSLHPADAKFLHELQAEYDKEAEVNGPLKRLSQLARGEMTWTEYCQDTMVDKSFIVKQMQRIVDNADIVLTTPAGSQHDWYKSVWAKAKVVAIDEAGCMSKADLCSIWGNTLRPIILGGDVKQLPPAMMELMNVDANGNNMNRFALAGRISALGWLQATGLPTFRLLHQMRMANDMFGLAQELFYGDHPIAYGPGSDPSLESHVVGRQFEEFLGQCPFKGYKRPPSSTLQPIFLHMPNTRARQVGSSKLNRTQVKQALELINDFVTTTNTSPKHFVVITGHRPNVEYGNRILRGYPALADMRKVQTVDSVQGDENTISVVILGTTSSSKSVGFISNQNRLNVMLTRQKSALVIIGDKLVTGALTGSKAQLNKLMEVAKKGKPTYDNSGEVNYSKTVALRKLLVKLQKMGRIVEIVTTEEAQKAREEELAQKERELAEAEEKAEYQRKVDAAVVWMETEWRYDTSRRRADSDDEDEEYFAAMVDF